MKFEDKAIAFLKSDSIAKLARYIYIWYICHKKEQRTLLQSQADISMKKCRPQIFWKPYNPVNQQVLLGIWVPSIPPQILVKVPAKRGLFSRPYFTPPVFNRKNSVTGGGETFHLHHIPHRDTVRSTRIRQPEQSPDVCFHPDENRKHRLLYKSCNDRKYSIWCSNLPITFHIVSKLFIKNESRIFISVKVRSF